MEIFCCASVTGYESVNVFMNQVGDTISGVEVKKKQEPDGSWTACAQQRTVIRRTSIFNQQLLTCELLTNNQQQSILSSIIVIKGNANTIRYKNKRLFSNVDQILPDGSLYYNTNFEANRNNDYFNGYRLAEMRSRRKLSTGVRFQIVY